MQSFRTWGSSLSNLVNWGVLFGRWYHSHFSAQSYSRMCFNLRPSLYMSTRTVTVNPIFAYLGLFQTSETLWSDSILYFRDFNWFQGYGCYMLFCSKDTCYYLLIHVCPVEVVIIPYPGHWHSWSSIPYSCFFTCYERYLRVLSPLMEHWLMHYKHKDIDVIRFDL
jgi:hypothetical protein